MKISVAAVFRGALFNERARVELIGGGGIVRVRDREQLREASGQEGWCVLFVCARVCAADLGGGCCACENRRAPVCS
jgi:hypothetical protein